MSELEELKMEKAEIKCEVEMLKEFTRMGKTFDRVQRIDESGTTFYADCKNSFRW